MSSTQTRVRRTPFSRERDEGLQYLSVFVSYPVFSISPMLRSCVVRSCSPPQSGPDLGLYVWICNGVPYPVSTLEVPYSVNKLAAAVSCPKPFQVTSPRWVLTAVP